MKIGCPTHPRKNIIKVIEWIGKNKFDFVEFFIEPDNIPEKLNPTKIKNTLKKYKLSGVGHMAWYLPIGSPLKSLRECAINEAKKNIDFFNKIGVQKVTIHSNWPFGMFKPEEGIKWQVNSLKKVVDYSKKYKINVVLEPVGNPLDSVENINKILNKVNRLYFHLDIGHGNLFGWNVEDYIKKFHKKLKHVHLHDNDGNSDLHLPMGVGIINWKKVIEILKKYYNGTITLEIFSTDSDYLLISKKKLNKLWKSSK